MMNFDITDLIYRVPNFLSDDECELLITEYEERANETDLESCPDANTGVNTQSTFKRVVLTPETKAHDLIFKKTEQAVNGYLEYLKQFNAFHIPAMRNAYLYSHVYRLLKYEVGAKIHPHTDHDAYTYGSITFNLNDDYTGGEFKFFNGKHTVKLNKGDMMIWPADYFWVHEVTPVETGARYSTNSFLISVPPEMREDLQKDMEYITSMFYKLNKIPKPEPYTITV